MNAQDILTQLQALAGGGNPLGGSHGGQLAEFAELQKALEATQEGVTDVATPSLQLSVNNGKTTVVIRNEGVNVKTTEDVTVDAARSVSVKGAADVSLDAGSNVHVASGSNVNVASGANVVFQSDGVINLDAAGGVTIG